MFKLTENEFTKAHALYQKIDQKTISDNPVSYTIFISCVNAAKRGCGANYTRYQFKQSMTILERAIKSA